MVELLDPTSQDVLDIIGVGSSKGDLLAADASPTFQKLPLGTDGFVLTADSAEALGVKWAAGASQTPWLSDIDADDFNLLNLGFYEMNQITEPADGGSQLARFWSEAINPNLSILRFKTGSGVIQTIQEDVVIQVRNTTGSTLTRGQAVFADGEDGTKINVDLARADVNATMPSLGLVVEDIPNNSNGLILAAGVIRNVDLSSFVAGQLLYVSDTTAGELTTSPPVHPNLRQRIGIVLDNSMTTGILAIIIGSTHGDETGTNANVISIGDGLAGAKTVNFVNADIGTLSWNPSANRTATIPDATTTLVGTGIADQLTNTELTSGVFGKITGVGTQIQTLQMGSQLISDVLDPIAPQDAATKLYVDSSVTGLNFKLACRVATTANITLSGNQTIDGVTTVNGDRVLVKEQTLGQNNGIYIADAGAWVRSDDTDTSIEITNMACLISEGTINDDTGWLLTTDPPINLGTTVLVFEQFTSLGQINAGLGLTKTGSTLDVGPTAGRISVSADAVDIDTAYVGQASITTLGTITTGVWEGTRVDSLFLDVDTVFVNVANSWTDDVKQIFNPGTNNAGINVGAHTVEPLTPVNGDIFYKSSTNELRARINGAWVSLGTGGGGQNQSPWLSDIDADDFNLLNLGFYELTQIAEPANGTSQHARFWVEAINNSLSTFKFKTSNGIVQTIQEDIILQVRNTTGGTLTKGSVVYATGENGNRITVDLARSDVDATMPAIGVIVEDIANNSNGILLNQGKVQNLNLSAFTAGDVLFVSNTTAGGFTTTKPPHPNLQQVIGIVLNNSSTIGELGVVIEQSQGGEEGTNENNFSIGNGLAGAKTLSFVNANTGALSWNPTAARTLTLPDITDTVAVLGLAQTFTAIQLFNSGIDLVGTNITKVNSLFMTQQAAADADVTDDGQWWVKTATPNLAYFTDDEGTDFILNPFDNIEIIIDGGGSAITTGIHGDLQVDFDCEILEVTMLADVSGSIVVDLWVDSYANFPADNADSITASAPPTITSTNKSQDSTLTGWTTAITAGSHIRYNVDSATTITRVTIALKVRKT